MSEEHDHSKSHSVIPPGAILPFILLASCFMWWAIANNLTDPLVKVFKQTFQMSTFQASLIQMAFYGGYFCMALPGAMIARKFTYKTGVLVGLGIYAVGCFLLYPAMMAEQFVLFCFAFYVLACGLGVLETNANPYVMVLGSEESATRRLNFAQAFNPIGAIVGIMLCRNMIMAKLPKGADGELCITAENSSEALNTVILPYLVVASILVVVWILILKTKMPKASEEDKHLHFFSTMSRLLKNKNYTFSVFAQFCYVGTQISVWTYTNFYIPEAIGVTQEVALAWHTGALVLFAGMRWVFTGLMRFFKASTLLMVAAILAVVAVLCVRGCPCLRIRLHVAHVPDHLRPRLHQSWRGYQAGLLRPDHGDCRRSRHHPDAGRHGRQVGNQQFLLAAATLLCRDWSVRIGWPQGGKGSRHSKLKERKP